jgi:bifunctional oligoribonuclease and PAP phosphatase NrnA
MVMFIEKYKIFEEKVKQAEKILVIGHLRPDGDAISSISAILEILKKYDKKALAYCSGPIPTNFDYLVNYFSIYSSIEDLNKKLELDKSNFLLSFDLLVVVDCGSIARTNLKKEILNSRQNKKPYIVEIDHHPKVDNYADLEIRHDLAASTTEIIYDLTLALKLEVNKSLAQSLLTGIIIDTGNFFYPNASAKTLKISAHLLEKGANLSKIIKYVSINKNMATFKLWALAMERLEVHNKYNLAYSILTLNDLEEVKADKEEINETLSSIAGFLSNLAKVKVSLLLHETSLGMIKGHLRSSNKETNIAHLARYFGGGGHPQASGFSVAGKLEKINNSWQIK